MRMLKENEVEFEVFCLPEHVPVRGNALASGDDKEDRAVEDSIINDLNNGNEWAWCCVKVVASWNGFVGYDTLSCCSYESREAFETDEYFDSMKVEALADLNRGVQETDSRLEKLR